ncbi:hypothetical protein ICW40_05780 [Actinotalea ferrariae]|uniref:hypothetical protein n=1 Tax=Actinotalea ferrariae TaxID=1386098 RepID=UPI001C8C2C27|nr:hypothetical protein [Actinotalea ferrariae]MBX9244316.1 hypothetical protein [Actinotalea ferrariae]
MSPLSDSSLPGDPRVGLDVTPWDAEAHDLFRLSQLILLLSAATDVMKPVPNLDRLGYYDFFAANPFVVIPADGTTRDYNDRLELKLAGFTEDQLSYASTGQRWVSRRRRLQHDLALLVAYGLVSLHGGTIALTEKGCALGNDMSTVYADAYRTSARVVVRRLAQLSDARLRANVQNWLGTSWLQVDLFDDVTRESGTIQGEAAR